MYSPDIENLIQAFKKLPTVGQRTAERHVFHLLKSGKKEVGELILALKKLTSNIKSCQTCWNFSNTDPCAICANLNRDKSIICIISQSQDIPVIEQTGKFNGLYHILRQTIKIDNQASLKNSKINELFARIKKDKNIKEVILALNLDLNGETTMMYLSKQLIKVNSNIKITRLARGLPMNSDLQYADEITLGEAIKNRK